MNSKGQTLVLFVILLPFIFILFVFALDIAKLSSSKVKLDDVAKTSVRYIVFDHKDLDDVKENIYDNYKDVKVEIDNNSVCLRRGEKLLFGSVIGYDELPITSCFKGKIAGGRLIIDKKGK